MSRNNRNRNKLSFSQKVFYALSLLIILSMLLSTIYLAITPGAF